MTAGGSRSCGFTSRTKRADEQAFLNSRSMKIDLTRLAADWIAGTDTHNQIVMIINAGGPDPTNTADTNPDGMWMSWQQSPGLGRWTPANGDAPWTLEWDYSDAHATSQKRSGFLVARDSGSSRRSAPTTPVPGPCTSTISISRCRYKASDPVPAKNATGVDRQTALTMEGGSGRRIA